MKVLLAINEYNDPVETARYLADRFGKSKLELHLLSVIDQPELVEIAEGCKPQLEMDLQRQAEHQQQISSMLDDYIKQLRFTIKPRTLSAHIKHGDPAEVVLNFARQLQADLLLLGAPRRQGLLTSFRLESVSRRALRWANCPVEIFRLGNKVKRQRILVPLHIRPDGDFILPELRHLSFSANSEVLLLGIMPPVFEENCTETNPASLLLKIQETRDLLGYTKSRLAEVRTILAKELPESISLQQLLIKGDPITELKKTACQLRPSLVVLDTQWGNQKSHLFSNFTPISLAMLANCSVISLGSRQNPVRSLQLISVSKWA